MSQGHTPFGGKAWVKCVSKWSAAGAFFSDLHWIPVIEITFRRSVIFFSYIYYISTLDLHRSPKQLITGLILALVIDGLTFKAPFKSLLVADNAGLLNWCYVLGFLVAISGEDGTTLLLAIPKSG